MTDGDDERLSAYRLMNALADEAEGASDEALLDDAAAATVDVAVEAERVRNVLLAGVLAAKKGRLHQAQQAHDRAVAGMARRSSSFPSDPAQRRAMLFDVLQRQPQMREAMVTLQHREFESFSDADVESVLHQLAMLGVLGDDGHEPGS